MTILLSDLLHVETQQEAFDALIASLKGVGFPTTGWATTSVPRRLCWAFASAKSSLQQWVYDVATGGLLKLATGKWLTLLADNMYQETRTAAQFLLGTFSIADVAGAGPFTISPNQLWFATDSGLRFCNLNGGTLAKDGTLELTIQAETSGAIYNVAQAAVVKLLTPLPGVSFAPHTAVKSEGTTPPVITVSGTPVSVYDFEIEITTGGTLGVADFQWRANGGAWNTATPTAATVLLTGTGVTVAFPAGTYGTDNTYSWTSGAGSYNPTPDWITTIGLDEQTDPNLQTVCQGKWATLGLGQNDDWYRYWIRKEPNYGPTVTDILVENGEFANPAVPGNIRIFFAVASGAPSGSAVTAIGAYMAAKKGDGITLIVSGSTSTAVDVTATLYVLSGTATATTVIAAATSKLQAYFATLRIHSSTVDGTVFLDQVRAALIYDPTIVHHLSISAPATDTAISTHAIGVLGTVALTVVFI